MSTWPFVILSTIFSGSFTCLHGIYQSKLPGVAHICIESSGHAEEINSGSSALYSRETLRPAIHQISVAQIPADKTACVKISHRCWPKNQCYHFIMSWGETKKNWNTVCTRLIHICAIRIDNCIRELLWVQLEFSSHATSRTLLREQKSPTHLHS